MNYTLDTACTSIEASVPTREVEAESKGWNTTVMEYDCYGVCRKAGLVGFLILKHAVDQSTLRRISVKELLEAIETGEII